MTFLQWGGMVKMDAFHDFNPIDNTTSFRQRDIVVGQRPSDIPESQTVFTARGSRIEVRFIAGTALGSFFSRVEADFAGDDNVLRLRHAYGTLVGLLAGQTWSTFVDEKALPFTLNFDGAGAFAKVRQAQIRYERRFGRRWMLAAALEEPESDITEPDAEGTPESRWPDLIGSAKFDKKRTHLHLAGLVRNVGFRAADDSGDFVTGWGFSFAGAIRTWGKDTFRFEGTAGRGIGRYISDLKTTGSDAGPTGAGSLEALPAFGFGASYERWWAAKWGSSFVFAYIQVENSDGQPDDAYHSTDYASANLFHTPVSNALVGVEAIWGRRVNKDRQEGTDIRLLFSFKYAFSYNPFTR